MATEGAAALCKDNMKQALTVLVGLRSKKSLVIFFGCTSLFLTQFLKNELETGVIRPDKSVWGRQAAAVWRALGVLPSPRI